MESGGYLGLTLLMVLENLFPPIPSEVVLPAAGFTAAQGGMNLGLVVLFGALGSVLGTLPLYYLGKVMGEDRAAAWADRYGRWLTVSGQDVRRAGRWFERHGQKAILFGRMVPGVRSLLSLPAGVAEMPLPKFLLYSFIGSGLWAGVLAGAGYLLGENYHVVERYVAPASKVIMGGLALGLVLWVLWRRRAQPEPQ